MVNLWKRSRYLGIKKSTGVKLKSPQPILVHHWLVDENETIDLTMCAIPKGASKQRIKAEFTSLMVDKYEEYDQIYTDGSLKDDKVEFAIVTNNQIIKKGLNPNPQYTEQNSKRS
jgi:hypothetical protein